MELQVVLPDESPGMDAQRPVELAVLAEGLGYRTAWLPDHLLPPAPYSDTYGGVYEPLVTLSFLAARTSSIRLGTSVLVLPMRSPFVVAKQAATLQQLSGGRLTLGVGIGWDRDEFAAVGADFRTRASRTDEGIRLLRALLSGATSFQGEYYSFESGVFEPQPSTPLPILVGGTSDRALVRAATLADEWQAVGLDPAEFAAHAARLRSHTSRDVRVSARIEWRGDRADRTRAVDRVRRFADAGAHALAVWFGSADGFDERMSEFAAALPELTG